MTVVNLLTQLIAMNGHSADHRSQEKSQMQKPDLSQVLTPQHPLSQLNPVNPVSLPVSSQKSTSSSSDDTDADPDSISSDDMQSTTSQTSNSQQLNT